MAFMATIDTLPQLRKQSHAPGNTGGRSTPKPRRPSVVDPRPPKPPRKPRCLPRKIVYPSKVGYLDAGPRGKVRWRYWYRYPCRRTSSRTRRYLRYTENGPITRGTHIDRVIPINDIDRNPAPIHKSKPTTISRSPLPTIPRIRYRLNEDFTDIDLK